MDFLYYWQRHAADTAGGPINKLNQNSPVMAEMTVGDDVWAFSLANRGLYELIARFTVCEVGVNPRGSADREKYGEYYFRSDAQLANYMDRTRADFEPIVRSLAIRCEGNVLGQCFQGRAAVRRLDSSDRRKLIAYVSQ